MKAGWYLRRLRRMSAAEMAARVEVAARQLRWSRPEQRPDGLASLLPGPRAAAVALRRAQAPGADHEGARAAVAAADRLLAGHWPIFHLCDETVGEVPDWFRDPLTDRVAPAEAYAFAVPYRDEAKVGNIKYVWEMSRHQATTVLACAWWLTGDPAYAERAAAHLRSWWRQNKFLCGVHWTSGIEVGLRLLSWTWIRALLADWPGMPALFDANPDFAGQLYHHQLYLRSFRSRGSSANNHLIAELAGLSAAAVAFPWFRESADWAGWARAGLVAQAARQTHADGWNREQASDYHLFVFEMLAAASLAARLAGRPLPPALHGQMRAMADALAASLDASGRPPRFGDGDDGRGLLLDAPARDGAGIVLDVAGALWGASAWWPAPSASVLGHIARLLAEPALVRAAPRPAAFPGAGMTLLRAGEGRHEIWARCDAGPHGFLSIAAHGHADALALEVRHGGVDILADPGTYCYHGEPEWRAYFKGTAGHSTLGIDGQDQARSAGPFLWRDQPRSRLGEVSLGGAVQSWQAAHDGYRRLADPVTHHRRVTLDAGLRRLTIEDWIEAGTAHAASLSFHFGPAVRLRLAEGAALLRWPGGRARMWLPAGLAWSAHRGERAPPLGWYSDGFGHRTPSFTLVGRGPLAPGALLLTQIEFAEV